MRTIQPHIDESLGCEVLGAIYASANADDLSEDMLEVNLPDGAQVCGGWSSSDAAYRITATKGLANVRSPQTTRNPDEATSLVERLVAELVEPHSIDDAEPSKRVAR